MQNNSVNTPESTFSNPQSSVDLVDTVNCLIGRTMAISRCLWLSIDNDQLVVTKEDIGRVCGQIEANLEQIKEAANNYHDNKSQSPVQAVKVLPHQRSAVRGKATDADIILEGSQHKLRFVQHYLQRKEEFDTDPVLIGCENVIADLHTTLGDMRDLVFDMSREIEGMKKNREVA